MEGAGRHERASTEAGGADRHEHGWCNLEKFHGQPEEKNIQIKEKSINAEKQKLISLNQPEEKEDDQLAREATTEDRVRGQ